MSVTDELLANNERYAAGFPGAELAKQPAKGVAVVCCMDTRLIPTRILGLDEGEAHVIRNAGGGIGAEELHALAISQHLLGTEEVIVIQHTDCGMMGFSDEEFAERLEKETGERPGWRVRTFSDLEQHLRDSLRAIKESPFIPHTDSVRGFVFEVESGRLREVE
jgi:carbonic anhydrase